MTTVTSDPDFKPGLEGVIAFETEIAEPDKEGGSLRYRGVDIEDLVGQVSYGNVWGLLVDNEVNPGLPPAEPFPLPVHSGDVRVDVQSALAMLAPAWGFRQLLDIDETETRDNLARASVMALSFVAQSARGIGLPMVPQREIDKATTIVERFMIRWRGEPDPRHVQAVDAYWCSAAEHGMNASTALTCRGSGSPRHRRMNRSTMVSALSMSFCGTAGSPRPRAACATNDSAVTDTRARSERHCSSLMSSSWLSPQYGASIATADCTSTRMSPECTGTGNGSAGGSPGPNRPSTSSAQTLPNETWPIRSSMSTPR